MEPIEESIEVPIMVEHDDPLASATLAQLYIAQGHVGRARRVIDQLLAEQPHHGPALVLRRRITAHGGISLSVELEDSGVLVRWRIRADVFKTSSLHILHVTHGRGSGPSAALTTSRVSSVHCGKNTGDLRIGRSHAPGSVSVALARVDAQRRIRILATAEPLSWSD